MKIDRQRVRDTFAEYASHYNAEDGKIKLKIDHTYRVAALSDRIAKSLGLSTDDVDLAWLIGMLHDVGRFEQLKNYGTFSDADSIDHAHYAVQILFDDNKIVNYVDIDEKKATDCEYSDIDIVRIAIWNHSAYRIEDGLDERTQMFCNIIRDADKVDILKVNNDVPLETIYNVTTQALEQDEVTEEVMRAFGERHAVLRHLKKTSVDNIVGHVALVFELVYQESYIIVNEQGYLAKLLAYQSKNTVTQKQFASLRDCMDNFLISKNII